MFVSLRNLAEIPDDAAPNAFETRSGLEIKVALGNYRMFFTPETEDYFHRNRTPAEMVESDLKEEAMTEVAKKRLDEFVARKMAKTEEQGEEEEGTKEEPAMGGENADKMVAT